MTWEQVLEEQNWKQDAECKGMDTNLFFTKSKKETNKICNQCSVQEECIMYSLLAPYDYTYRDSRNNRERDHIVMSGIWGGLNKFERQALLRRMIHARMPNIGVPRKFWNELNERELRRNKKKIRVKRKD